MDCVEPCVFLDDPAWSPDGESILFSRMTEQSGAGRSTLELLHLDTNDVEVLLDAGPTDLYAGARWSPDGRTIVLEVAHRTGTAIDADISGVTLSIVELGTRPPTVRPLTSPDLFAETADWSPDGTLIVYAALAEADSERHDLYTIHPDGTGLKQVTPLAAAGGNATHASFTPDSKRIVFVAQLESGDDEVMATIGIEGSEPASATGTGFRNGVHPRMRPTP